MYEKSEKSGQHCLNCNKELGFLDPNVKKLYTGEIKTQRVFSNREHPKFKKKRQRCFDCAFNEFNDINFRPNVHTNYTGFLFDVEIDMSTFGVTLENMTRIYGTELGTNKFNEYRKKQSISNTFEYKRDKYGWSEEKFNEFNKSRGITLENMIKKYGDGIGTKKFDEYRSRQAYTNTLDYFISKYGLNDGTLKYDTICKQKAITLENMIRIYGVEKGPDVYINHKNNNSGFKFYSSISQELFWNLSKKIDDKCYFGENGGEFGINSGTRYYFYDFVISKTKKIIEFNGDYWHARPSIHESTWVHPHSKLKAL
jgi:hypothetical protein